MRSIYTKTELTALAKQTLMAYRKRHKDKIRRYVFDDIPWFISISDEGIQFAVQIKNREAGWTENITIAL